MSGPMTRDGGYFLGSGVRLSHAIQLSKIVSITAWCFLISETEYSRSPTLCQWGRPTFFSERRPLSASLHSTLRKVNIAASRHRVKDFFGPPYLMFASDRPLCRCPVSEGSVTISTAPMPVKGVRWTFSRCRATLRPRASTSKKFFNPPAWYSWLDTHYDVSGRLPVQFRAGDLASQARDHPPVFRPCV
jgi:hypothetical protein